MTVTIIQRGGAHLNGSPLGVSVFKGPGNAPSLLDSQKRGDNLLDLHISNNRRSEENICATCQKAKSKAGQGIPLKSSELYLFF